MNKAERKPDPAPSQRRLPVPPAVLRFSRDARYQRYFLLLVLAVVLTVVIIPKGALIPDYYAPGDIASRNVKAPKDLLIQDQPLTEKKRREAEEAVLPLYDYDSRVGQDVAERLIQSIRLADQMQRQEAAPELLRREIEGRLGISLSDKELAALVSLKTSEELEAALRQLLIRVLGQRIVGNLQLFVPDRDRGIVLRDLKSQNEIQPQDLSDVIGIGEVQNQIEQQLKGLPQLSSSRSALAGIIHKIIRPSLTFNKNETEARKQNARLEVKPVLFQIKKGEMIVREGERVTEEQITKLRAIRDFSNDSGTLRMAAGLLVCSLLLLFTCHRFARRNIRKYRPGTRDLLFLAATFTVLLSLVKVGIFIANALESAFPYIDSTSYYTLFPFAVGAMLVRIVLNSEMALVFAVAVSILLGILFGNNLFIVLFSLVGSLCGAHYVRQCERRSTLYQAGLWVAATNVALILGIHLFTGRALDLQFFFRAGFGAAGGLLCALTVTGLVPLVESVFKYTTDIRLLELANLNNPVMRELMIQAPGTYHHSVIVGNLVESAAEAINANPLLARVAAYYHDIGKIRKPQYFVENLGQEENRHDKLTPSMSALILMSHVKDGVELAREHRLGEALVDIIRQHHGTALIKFFYDKAKSKESAGAQQVDERDYRYPGPKPQTREAALIMLADAVEAASRTLADPTPARIQGMVQKIINNIFIDGQLNDCELTLKDLHNIAKSFNRILAGIFHHRIDYPEPAYKERDKDGAKRKNGEDSNREPAKEAQGWEADAETGSKEDLKRLGMS